MTSSPDGRVPAPGDAVPWIELADPADLASRVSGDKKTVVLFEKSGCPYCVPYQPRFAELAAMRRDLDFLRVKLDDPRNPLWEAYGIHAVPTFIAFARGEIVARADSTLALGLSKKKWSDFCAVI